MHKPERLYISDDLLRSYDKNDALGVIKPWDFGAYRTCESCFGADATIVLTGND
jgi:hypothetical protein